MTLGVSSRALAVDAGAVATVGVAICLAAHRLPLMTALVPTVLLARFALYLRLPRGERLPGGVELAFFVICTALGAFNDLSSVVIHRVYEYRVPVYFPGLSTIPMWMLLYWGLVLRFVASLAWWSGLADESAASPRALLPRGDRPWLRLLAMLAFVGLTRLTIYRFYLDPWRSWLPFAAAAVAYVPLFGLDRRERILALVFAVGGPLVEAAFIRVGGLHHYHLGWFLGVPLWIVIWWVLSVLVWKELSDQLIAALTRLRPKSDGLWTSRDGSSISVDAQSAGADNKTDISEPDKTADESPTGADLLQALAIDAAEESEDTLGYRLTP